MTGVVDTPEEVEAMAAWHGEGKAWPSDVPMPQLHSGPASCPASAAMLRRLHQRAVDAERERDELQGLLVTHEICADRIKATARADALREGLEAVKGIDTADIYSTGERHAAEEIRDFAVFLIGNLIEQPTTTTGET